MSHVNKTHAGWPRKLLIDFVGLALLLLGVFAGFFGALLGVGGGLVVVPFLILFFLLDAHEAIGTSITIIVFTAISGTWAYYRQRRIDWKIGLLAASVTVPGAALGALSTEFLPSRTLGVMFGVFQVLVGVITFRRSVSPASNSRTSGPISGGNDFKSGTGMWNRRIVDAGGEVFEYRAKTYTGLVLLFLGGFASGFLGIGGGLIVVPIFTLAVGLPMHIAVATSMLTMIFTSVSGVTAHIVLGNVRIEFTLPLVLGALYGTQLGAEAARKLKSRTLERIFAMTVLAIGVWLIISRM